MCTKSHGELLIGKAEAAAIYPDELCRTICRAVAEQRAHDRAGTVATKPMSHEDIQDMIGSLRPGSISNLKEHYEGSRSTGETSSMRKMAPAKAATTRKLAKSC